MYNFAALSDVFANEQTAFYYVLLIVSINNKYML